MGEYTICLIDIGGMYAPVHNKLGGVSINFGRIFMHFYAFRRVEMFELGNPWIRLCCPRHIGLYPGKVTWITIGKLFNPVRMNSCYTIATLHLPITATKEFV